MSSRGHLVVLHAAGLDDDEALFAVDAADVAPGEGDQAVLGEEEVGRKDLFLEFLQHHSLACSFLMAFRRFMTSLAPRPK